EVFEDLTHLHGDKGVWRLLDQRAGEVIEVPVAGPIPLDVATPEDSHPIHAPHPPVIVLPSNRTRDLHDAVKRRCLYQWIDYPSRQREVDIVRRRVKGASETL